MPFSIKSLFIGLVLFCYLLTAIFYPRTTLAQNVNIRCNPRFQNYVQSVNLPAAINLGETFNTKVIFTSTADISFNYYLKFTQPGTDFLGQNTGNTDYRTQWKKISDPAKPEIDFSFDNRNDTNPGDFEVILMHAENFRGEEEVCKLGAINFADKDMNEMSCNLKMPDNVEQGKSFIINLDKVDKPNHEYAYYFFSKGDIDINKLPKGMAVVRTSADLAPISTFTPGKDTKYSSSALPNNAPGETGIPITYNNGQFVLNQQTHTRLPGGEYVAVAEARRLVITLDLAGTLVQKPVDRRWLVSYCSYHPFKVSSEPTSPETDGTVITKPGTGGTLGGEDLKTETCLEKLRKDPNAKCAEAGGKRIPGCGGPDDPRGAAIATAIGCIHTNPVEFTKDLMRFVIGISGGLAFLMMLMGAFQILSSGDNPDTLKAGRERLTSAVIGLLIVIFAILLLQIIGVGILDIPGFGK